MAFKLKTSKKAAEIFSRIESSEYLQCYTLVKLAIALSLRSEEPLKDSDFHTNTLGRELNRQTITGDADALYKCLMEYRAVFSKHYMLV
jgi:DNA sulfur modification protein DndE